MTWQATGSFRQRARVSDRATQQLGEQRRRHAAVRTHEALQKFDEYLLAEQEAQFKDFDEIPAEAEGMMRSKDASDLAHKQSSTFDMSRSHSQPHLHNREIEKDPSTKRPPSPLTYYDYGSLSMRPRSLFAQHKQRLGESVRPKHRQTSCGFYFPGTQFKHGPYGFSMMDPCLLPPRTWAASPPVPTRWCDDLSNARPLDTQALGLKRNRSAGPVISSTVRTTQAHTQRAKRTFMVLDKQREEAVLEHARFENGVYEGKWRDPMLETKGQLPEACPPERHDWLGLFDDDMSPAQQLAQRIVFGIYDVQTRFRGGLLALFAPENRGGPGVLEPTDFLHALVRLGVMVEGECTIERLVQAISVIDQSSDGRVSLPALARAIGVARGLRKQQRQATERQHQQRQVFLNTKYSDSVPVDIVKLDKNSKSLYNFERSLEKFRSQQRELLIQHNEVDGGESEPK